MYRFALTPKWIAGHVLALVLVTCFIAAGFWQLSRHNNRVDLNETIEGRADLPVLAASALDDADPAVDEYRVAEASGVWSLDLIFIRGQSFDGQPGCHVVTVLERTDSPSDVVVNRGWAHLSQCESPDRTQFAAPAGAATVVGRVRASAERGRFQTRDPAEGVLSTMARVDIARIEQQWHRPLAPVYLEVIETTPADDAMTVLGQPDLGNGPHLGYAVQWFLFAAVGIVGYPIVLRRQARDPNEIAPVD